MTFEYVLRDFSNEDEYFQQSSLRTSSGRDAQGPPLELEVIGGAFPKRLAIVTLRRSI